MKMDLSLGIVTDVMLKQLPFIQGKSPGHFTNKTLLCVTLIFMCLTANSGIHDNN